MTLPVPGALEAQWARTAATELPETHCDRPWLCRASRQPGPAGRRRGNVPLRPTHGGRAEMLEPARAPAILTPVGLLIRLKTRGTGFSERERSARQQDEAPSGPVWPGSHDEQLKVPDQRVPFRLLRGQSWSHFKAKPPATPPRAPERPIQAQPRPVRLAAATPTVARVTVREGRDSGGERRKPELPAPPSEPEALKPRLEAGGCGRAPRPGQVCATPTGARPPSPGPGSPA